MPKIDYPPSGYVSLRALRLAWVARRLGKDTWSNPYRAKGDPVEDTNTLKAVTENQGAFEEALRTGELETYAFDESGGSLRPLPREFWCSDASTLSLDGRLYSIAPEKGFEQRHAGALIVVEAMHATDWLGSRGFLNSDRFYPLELIKQPSRPARRTRRKQYNWLEFQNEVIKILDEEGRAFERGFQSDLLQRMETWCDQRWGKVPGRTSMQRNINLAVQNFLEMRRTD